MLQHFMEFKKQDQSAINCFYERCRAERSPAVWIEMRRKTVDLFWDMATVPPGWDRWFHPDREKIVTERIHGVFATIAGPQSGFVCSFFYGVIWAVPVDCARRGSRVIYELLARETTRAMRLAAHA